MICDSCGIRPANHSEFRPVDGGVQDLRLCCLCWVVQGNAPYDGHEECVAAYAHPFVQRIRIETEAQRQAEARP